MPDSHTKQNEFLSRITKIIEENISNEQFGVSELAAKTGMSRSNLLRKIKSITDLSVSQFIRQVRLEQGMDMLRRDDLTVSEIAYLVGFSSPSYFIKCFREHYGYPPGEAGKKEATQNDSLPINQPGQSHQLSAIMFTDIQGYTALMQGNEVKAIEFRNRHREVFNATTEKYRGKILQYWGDGTLSTFSSAIDAVRCAIEMQLSFRQDPEIPVRIGIHTGDIIFTEDDIIGDGVNVASRIESLAAAGSVFISEKVYDEVKNQQGIQTASMGVFELKNVDKAMEVFAISNPGLVIPKREQVVGKLKGKLPERTKGPGKKGKWAELKWALLVVVAFVVGYLIYTSDIFEKSEDSALADQTISKKSIAVLPFINDSNDSTNVYIINGLMESILNNLQKIKDLRVISRTSVEKYRSNPKSIPEIARELNVKYIVEGSGQKVGDQILLTIQLIEAQDDEHIWSEQYNREARDIFALQMEVAKNIAEKIEVIITPEEEALIEKAPTDDLVAYDYFLKGLDYFNRGTLEGLVDAIPLFRKATQHDPEFALAYADMALSYYYMDILKAEKLYTDSLNFYAEKALLFDPKMQQSLVAKALYYMVSREYEMALPYLEKALEYNPNSVMVIRTLSEFYSSYSPDTEKYLEYALKGINLDIASNDSATKSYIYLHVSNAFIQSGFIDEAENYVNRSLNYFPENLFSQYVRAYILYARNRDLQKTKERLIDVLKKDTTRLDVLQEVAKICYFMRDYESAYHYYRKFVDAKKKYGYQIFSGEDAKIALVFSEMGFKEESDSLLNEFYSYAESDQSIYKHLSLAAYYSYKGKTKRAIDEMKLFSKEKNYQFWIILFLDIDPLMDNIKDLPEFKKILKDLENKFWKKHEQIKERLEGEGLI
jgi:TolB-like protein/class 3 adenylate cyclase/Tfp pilus assembly protein PilF